MKPNGLPNNSEFWEKMKFRSHICDTVFEPNGETLPESCDEVWEPYGEILSKPDYKVCEPDGDAFRYENGETSVNYS